METLRRECGALGWLLRTSPIGAAAAAIYKELQLPPEKRTWQGRLLGFVPYDFRAADAASRHRRVLGSRRPIGCSTTSPSASAGSSTCQWRCALVQRVIGSAR